jgi:hypothetical protein
MALAHDRGPEERKHARDKDDDDDDMPGPNAGATLWPATLVRHRVVA